MDLSTLEEYLKQYGWTYEKPEEVQNVLITQFMANAQDLKFLVVIQLTLPWLRMHIPIYSPLPSNEMHQEFFKRLLQLNHSSRQVFFALDKNNLLTLCADLFVPKELSYEQFEAALTSLVYVAEEAYPFLNNLS